MPTILSAFTVDIFLHAKFKYSIRFKHIQIYYFVICIRYIDLLQQYY